MDLDSPAAIGSGVRESSIDMNFDSLAALVSGVRPCQESSIDMDSACQGALRQCQVLYISRWRVIH